MKAWFCAAGYFLIGSSLLWSAVPPTRVVDPGKSMSPSARMLLEDHLESMAKTQQVSAYVVILPNESAAEASKLCDQWQAEWVPGGLGGVFAFCVATRKYSFTGTSETSQKLDDIRLSRLFNDPLKNPLLASSLDVEITAPVFRVLTALGEERITYREKAIEAAQTEIFQWKVFFGLAIVVAVAGWALSFGKFIQSLPKAPSKGSIPPPGMAYGNPPKRKKKRTGRNPAEERY